MENKIYILTEEGEKVDIKPDTYQEHWYKEHPEWIEQENKLKAKFNTGEKYEASGLFSSQVIGFFIMGVIAVAVGLFIFTIL